MRSQILWTGQLSRSAAFAREAAVLVGSWIYLGRRGGFFFIQVSPLLFVFPCPSPSSFVHYIPAYFGFVASWTYRHGIPRSGLSFIFFTGCFLSFFFLQRKSQMERKMACYTYIPQILRSSSFCTENWSPTYLHPKPATQHKCVAAMEVIWWVTRLVEEKQVSKWEDKTGQAGRQMNNTVILPDETRNTEGWILQVCFLFVCGVLLVSWCCFFILKWSWCGFLCMIEKCFLGMVCFWVIRRDWVGLVGDGRMVSSGCLVDLIPGKWQQQYRRNKKRTIIVWHPGCMGNRRGRFIITSLLA